MADIGNGYVGGEAKFYYNSATYGSPTWVLIENCEDLDVADSRTEVETKVRSQWPIIGHLVGGRKIALTWNGLKTKLTTDSVTTALITAYENGTVTEFAVADATIATTGTKYRRMISVLSKADESQPIDSPVGVAFAAVPALNNSGNAPSRATVA